jgi:hypothetical protein
MNGRAASFPQTLNHRVAAAFKKEGRRGVNYDRGESLASHNNYIAHDIQEKDEKECTDDREELIEAEAFGCLEELNLALFSRPQTRYLGQHLAEHQRRNVESKSDQCNKTKNWGPNEIPEILHPFDQAGKIHPYLSPTAYEPVSCTANTIIPLPGSGHTHGNSKPRVVCSKYYRPQLNMRGAGRSISQKCDAQKPLKLAINGIRRS